MGETDCGNEDRDPEYEREVDLKAPLCSSSSMEHVFNEFLFSYEDDEEEDLFMVKVIGNFLKARKMKYDSQKTMDNQM